MSSSSWSGARVGNNKELYDKIQNDVMVQYSSMEEVLKRIMMDAGRSKYASRRDNKYNIQI